MWQHYGGLGCKYGQERGKMELRGWGRRAEPRYGRPQGGPLWTAF